MQPTALGGDRQKIREAPLPCFTEWRERLIIAEQGAGWFDECDDAKRFLAVSSELVDALALTLRRFAGNSLVLEVCAGAGELAGPLNALGVRLQATDINPPEGSKALRLSAQAALHRFHPVVVLGVFVPHDAEVNEVVLACPSVQHYIMINARIGGAIGSASLWNTPDWKAEPLDDIRRWVITRHDVWLGHSSQNDGNILQHGEAWYFARTAPLSGKVRSSQ